jgi:hypothetical protein
VEKIWLNIKESRKNSQAKAKQRKIKRKGRKQRKKNII